MNMIAPPNDCGGPSPQAPSYAECRPQRGPRSPAEAPSHQSDAPRPTIEIQAQHGHHLHHAHHLLPRNEPFRLLDMSSAEALVKKVLRDSPYREHSLLEVYLTDGELELRGETSTFFMKQMAQELAKLAAPEVRIRNLVQVKA